MHLTRDRSRPAWNCARCGHTWEYHQHYHACDYCGISSCMCPAYRMRVLARLRDWLAG